MTAQPGQAPAHRTELLNESTIRGLTVYAASKGAVNLGQGSPDIGPPPEVVEAAHENYHAGVIFAGASPVWVPIRPPEHRFDPDELARAMARRRVRAVIFNSPHNPSGRVFRRDELDTIARLCIEHDVIAIADEIYEHMTYDGRVHLPIASLPGMRERTIMISGLSKSYAATGSPPSAHRRRYNRLPWSR